MYCSLTWMYHNLASYETDWKMWTSNDIRDKLKNQIRLQLDLYLTYE